MAAEIPEDFHEFVKLIVQFYGREAELQKQNQINYRRMQDIFSDLKSFIQSHIPLVKTLLKSKPLQNSLSLFGLTCKPADDLIVIIRSNSSITGLRIGYSRYAKSHDSLILEILGYCAIG
jgi:hypothetical protein